MQEDEIELVYWAIQWGNSAPHDVDFYCNGNLFWDLELNGEVWDSYQNPEVITYDVTFSTNKGQTLSATNWIHPRWIPESSGEVPEGFVARSYSAIFYSDNIRTSIIKVISGGIDIDDANLIDKEMWFISKIKEVTPNQTINKYDSVDLYCKIHQPSNSHLEITVQHGNLQPVSIYNDYVTIQVKETTVTQSHLFNSYGTYIIKYKLTTYQGSYIDNWWPASSDYVEESETIIQVGQS